MAKRRITFEVETTQLFDKLAVMNGDWSPVCQRIVSVLLMDPSWRDVIGLASYGVTVVDVPLERRAHEA